MTLLFSDGLSDTPEDVSRKRDKDLEESEKKMRKKHRYNIYLLPCYVVKVLWPVRSCIYSRVPKNIVYASFHWFYHQNS